MTTRLGKIAHRTRAAGRLLAPGVQMPVYLLMFVTNRCDAKCAHCFYHEDLNTTRIPDELTIEEFDKLARNLGPMFQVTLTGGSPELRKDLPAVAARFHEHCKPANMTWCMNGYHTGMILSHAETVMKELPDQHLTIGISLDGIGEEHDELRGMPGLYERVKETLRELKKLKESGYEKRLRLATAIVVHGRNHESAEETAVFARRELPVDLLKPILVRGDPKDPATRNIDKKAGRSYVDLVNTDHPELRDPHHARTTAMAFLVSAKEMVQRGLISEIQESGEAPLTCAGARETAVVYPKGEVAGCELRDNILGQLRENDFDFRKIWYGAAADEFRNTRDPDQCPGCYHHCFIAPPIFRSPRLWGKLATASLKLATSRSN